MIKKLFFLCLLVTSVAHAQIPTTGLQAMYEFTGGSYTDAANGNNLTQTGTALTTVNDRFAAANNAVSLNGDHLTRTNINFTDLTLSFWIRTSTNDNNVRTIIDDSGRSSASFAHLEYGLYVYLRNGKIGISGKYSRTNTFNNQISNASFGQLSNTFVADGNWHHIVVSLDQNHTISSHSNTSSVFRHNTKIYVDNGTPDANNSTEYGRSLFASVNTNGNVTIANNRSGNLAAANKYQDEIDDVFIYSRVLNPTEVGQLGVINNFCFVPSSSIISTSNITTTEATVAISETGTFDVAYHKTSEAFASATIVTGVTSGSSVLTGLEEFTEYQVYVREQCTSQTTGWSQPDSFTTNRNIGRIYVNHAATGSNNGVSWANAYTSLAEAFTNVQANEEIWVAQGTYIPHASDRTKSFTFGVAGIKLYGGFIGTETNISQRDVKANETILSGDLSANDDANLAFSNSTRNDNSYHVVYVNANNSLLDGFTISDAHTNGNTSELQHGGGVFYGAARDQEVRNCTFKNNVVTSGGAAIVIGINGNNGYTKIYNSTFHDNLARHATSIYYITQTSNIANAEVSSCLFYNNKAQNNGSSLGFAASGGWFRANAAGSRVNVELVNNTYVNNEDTGTSSSLNNFTRATVGIGYGSSGQITANVANNIFWNNTTVGGASAKAITGIHTTLGQNITVKNSISPDSFSTIPSGSVSNVLNADPQFTNAASNDFSLQATSTAIDAGDNNSLPFSVGYDVAGNPRLYNGTVDMGAFEQVCASNCYTLTINTVGEGSVTNNGNSISAVSVFNQNEVLSLEATADLAYSFQGWSGDATGTTNPLALTMDADKTITVTFANGPIYVDKDATGNNDGTSWVNAFTDLKAALNVANSNSSITSVWVAEGRYTPAASGRSSTFSINRENLEVYGGFDGTETLLSQRDVINHPTILSGDLSNNDTAIAMTHPTRNDNAYNVVKLNANNITLDGLTIRDGHANNAANNKTNVGAGVLVSETINGFNLKNCTIARNMTRAGGAVMSYFNADAVANIENCHFDNNRSRYGSGLYLLVNNNRTVTLNITNSLFTNNRSEKFTNTELGFSGSAVWARANGTAANLTTTITNCTFAKNVDIGTQASTQRGALSLSRRTDGNSTHNVTISNSIIYNNTGAGGATTHDVNRAHVSLPNQVLVNNSIGALNFSLIPSGNLTNTSNTDPLFKDVANNDFTLQPSSPAVNAGDNSKIPSGITKDLQGNNRILDATVDMGAYETVVIPRTLTLNATNGSISTNPNPTNGTYFEGTSVVLTATPDAGYQFDGWSGDATGSTNPLTITMDADKTVTATFSKIQRTLTVNATNGSVSTNPNPTNGTYDDGTSVVLTATPDAGYQFDGWSGDATGNTNPLTITMDADKTVTATFSKIQRTLTVNATNGTVGTNPNPTNGTYDDGTSVVLTAIPNAGYQFDGWSGDVTGNTNPLTITMDADKTITATFSKIQRTLTVNATNGSVSTNPSPTNGTYDDGTSVVLTATPDAGYQFDGWSGDATGNTNPLTITMDADKNITAMFSKIQRTLTVNATNGSVSTNPNPTNGTYDDGTSVVLTATPDAGYQFDGWSGDATGNTNPLTITMDADKNITAMFSKIQRTLTVNATNGSVSTNPTLTNGTYDDGTSVVLTATPDAGYQFDGWSGDATGNTNPLTITMDADKTVTATFSKIQRTLTVNATNGTVGTNPNPTNGTYDDGTSVVLTATPDAGYQFDGWSGDATGNTNPLTITMDADKTVTATFSKIQRTLTVNATNGSVSTNPNPTNGTYDDGTSVVLTATPDAGYQFDGWSGDATGNTNPLTITMDADKTVTATFSKIQRTLTVNATNGSVSTNPNPTNGTYDDGTSVVLTATPDAGYQFDGWSGDATGNTNPLTITMDADKNITAMFSKIQYELTIVKVGNGSIVASPSGTNGMYDEGTVVTLTATPDSGWQFDAWSGDVTGTTTTITITMSANQTVTGTFSQVTAGIDDEKLLKDFSVYPNPTAEVLNVKLQETVNNITIYTIQGKKVMQSKERVINVSELPSGIYLIKIDAKNNKTGLTKFVKQ
ncbi:putative repeat protein (TIGR02543 family)/predicted secreted protein (Por secretion system target) [Tenacibaculum sp. 190524A02b]|uniref:Repeat protein (TIGR02543 family)/predicted secreted protein (Por secretion system target) n=1 Tax=Tenacibaculum vairaonense TaxID=3137860 RepID=A0ABP1F3N6_9FLAO